MSNYRQRLHELPVDSLSRTFQDAIAVTQGLGIRYLWIDSLCIIQQGDQGQDWAKEASRMAQYYRQSLLTLAATCGSVEEGLCPSQVPDAAREIVRLPYRDREGIRKGHFYIYNILEMTDYYTHLVQRSSLFRRGWVLQERLLSRRVVSFTPIGVFMECQTKPPQNEHGEAVKTEGENWHASTALTSVLPNDFKKIPVKAWYTGLVISFCALELTFPDMDRTKAILGIATEFQEALMDHFQKSIGYAHGIWEKDLHYGLLWIAQSTATPEAFRRLPGQPTWSWTSLLVQPKWDPKLDDAKETCHVLEFKPQSNATAAQSSTSEQVRPVIGQDNEASTILVRSRLQPIIFGFASSEQHSRHMFSESTGPGEWSYMHWLVYAPSRPKAIAGWASVEHEDFQTVDSLVQAAPASPILALYISSRKAWGGLSLGYISFWHNVFNVLFVQEVDNQRYRRIGAGLLFGKEFERGFSAVEARDIELI